jgi:hypothetical protein
MAALGPFLPVGQGLNAAIGPRGRQPPDRLKRLRSSHGGFKVRPLCVLGKPVAQSDTLTPPGSSRDLGPAALAVLSIQRQLVSTHPSSSRGAEPIARAVEVAERVGGFGHGGRASRFCLIAGLSLG